MPRKAEAEELYIGLISGTSLDGIDAGLFKLTKDKSLLLETHHLPFKLELKQRLADISQPGANEIDLAGELDIELGQLFAETAIALLKKQGLGSAQITAIGSHGQTIRHRPNQHFPFSLQIGDPNTIAYRTKITTVADFRRRDMCAGGQGAPLAPAFHRAVFFDPNEKRCIVNIGGMANLSILEETPSRSLGYDSGPGNILMDAWVAKCLGKSYDEDGAWAATGTSHPKLLAKLLNHPYFANPYPKSTGREDFHLDWLLANLQAFKHLKPEDVQATISELSASSIASSILNHNCNAIYLCGGGAHNSNLVARISAKLPEHQVNSTEDLGIGPDWVETGIFAWLAKRTLERKNGSIAAVTGALSDNILGAIYPG